MEFLDVYGKDKYVVVFRTSIEPERKKFEQEQCREEEVTEVRRYCDLVSLEKPPEGYD